MKKVALFVLTMSLLVLANVPLASSGQAAAGHSTAAPGAVSGPSTQTPSGAVNPDMVTFLCSTGVSITGVFAGPNGGAYVLDQNSGHLLWCATGSSSVVASPPRGAPTHSYYGLAGVKTALGTVLVADYAFTGFWFCIGATASGCSIRSSFVNITQSFCVTTPKRSCITQGVALDSKLNVYLVDENNLDVVKCTYASAYSACSVIEPSSNFTGGTPGYIFRDSSGNIWLSDISCAGNVWENGVVKYTVGDALYGITMSKTNPSHAQHLYVAVQGLCTSSSASIRDLTDGNSLPILTPHGYDAVSLTTTLQYGTLIAGNVYKTADRL